MIFAIVAVDLGASSGGVMLEIERECRSRTLRECHRFNIGLHRTVVTEGCSGSLAIRELNNVRGRIRMASIRIDMGRGTLCCSTSTSACPGLPCSAGPQQ